MVAYDNWEGLCWHVGGRSWNGGLWDVCFEARWVHGEQTSTGRYALLERGEAERSQPPQPTNREPDRTRGEGLISHDQYATLIGAIGHGGTPRAVLMGHAYLREAS